MISALKKTRQEPKHHLSFKEVSASKKKEKLRQSVTLANDVIEKLR